MKTREDILLAMAKSRSISKVWELHTSAMKQLGFDKLVYGFTNFPNRAGIGDASEGVVLSNHSSQYMEYFVGKRMYFHGPMTKWAAQNEGACSWSYISELASNGELTLKEAEVVQINQKFGITAGYTISFHSEEDTAKGAIGMAAQDGLSQTDVDEIFSAHQTYIELISYGMHNQISRLPQSSDVIKKLSRRQQEVLQWAAEGKTIEETGIILNIAPATVEKHIAGAKDALNTSSTSQAVMVASRSNLFLKLMAKP